MNDTAQSSSLNLQPGNDVEITATGGNLHQSSGVNIDAPSATPVQGSIIPDEPEANSMKIAYIIDMSATDPAQPRDHQIMWKGIAKTFSFEAGKPTKLPRAVAIKFLRNSENFRLSNKEGDELIWQPTPKQPGDLEAGQRLELSSDETIARYDELQTDALRVRAMQLNGGESFGESNDRDAMISFIIETIALTAQINSEKDMKSDEYVPEPEVGEF